MSRRQDIVPGVLELDLDAIDPIAGVICGARTWALHEGDAIDLRLPPECADALIMDPPAGIKFMGKAWDSDKGGEEQWVAWLASVLRVAFDALKPGAHVLLWSLPRTSDWTAQALRKAGFVIRDTIDHVSGSGFPKSLDISKAIDAAAGATRESVCAVAIPRGTRDGTNALGGAWREDPQVTAPATPEAKRWAGWGTALRPNKEVWWLAMKPRANGFTIAANVLRHGVGGINVDAAAVPRATGDGWPSNITFQHSSWDESECRACGVVVPFAARFCPACGSGDVEAKRGGCRCVGERRVSSSTGVRGEGRAVYGGGLNQEIGQEVGFADEDGLETVDAWECLATCDRCGESVLVLAGGVAGRCACGAARRWSCPVALLDEQSGSRSSGARAAGAYETTGYTGGWQGKVAAKIDASEGGASRFYHCFPPEPFEPPPLIYSPKPSTREREAGLFGEAGGAPLPRKRGGEITGREEGSRGLNNPRSGAQHNGSRANDHPTVKGFHLLGHFLDLVLPPGGLVLDLTAGSGTLGAVVAHRHQVTGWRCIMAELDPGHCMIIRGRCKYWGARPWRPRGRSVPRMVSTKAAAPVEQAWLFASMGAR